MQSSLAADYGTIKLNPKMCLFDSDTGIRYGVTPYPQTFESHKLYSGLMLYETTLPAGYSGRGYLVADDMHDRAYVYVNQVPTYCLLYTSWCKNEGPEYIICHVGSMLSMSKFKFSLSESSLFSKNHNRSLNYKTLF